MGRCEAVGPLPQRIAALAVPLPWLAACTGRLRDAGRDPWWQPTSLAPVGALLVLPHFLTYPGKTEAGAVVEAVG